MNQAERKRAIARSIRRLRAEKGLRQQDLALVVGVSISAISSWERASSTPSIDKIWKLADFFEVPAAEVMGKVEIVSREIIPSHEHDKGDADA